MIVNDQGIPDYAGPEDYVWAVGICAHQGQLVWDEDYAVDVWDGEMENWYKVVGTFDDALALANELKAYELRHEWPDGSESYVEIIVESVDCKLDEYDIMARNFWHLMEGEGEDVVETWLERHGIALTYQGGEDPEMRFNGFGGLDRAFAELHEKDCKNYKKVGKNLDRLSARKGVFA